MEKEIWKDVDGYEGIYQVSNFGRVRSLPRFVRSSYNSTQFRQGGILKLGRAFSTNHGKKREGYLQAGLSMNGSTRYFLVHRLVLITFSGSLGEGLEVCHKDGNSKNNNLNNLKWGTHKENMQDAVNDGTSKRMGSKLKCEDHWKARFTNKDVSEMRAMFNSGLSKIEIENIYKVKRGALNHILSYRQWKNI